MKIDADTKTLKEQIPAFMLELFYEKYQNGDGFITIKIATARMRKAMKTSKRFSALKFIYLNEWPNFVLNVNPVRGGFSLTACLMSSESLVVPNFEGQHIKKSRIMFIQAFRWLNTWGFLSELLNSWHHFSWLSGSTELFSSQEQLNRKLCKFV